MTLHQRPPGEALPAARPRPPERGRWSWQRAAQGVWFILALVLLANFVANIPFLYQSLNTFCNQPSPVACPAGQLTLGNVQALSHLHLSVTAVAILLATITLAMSVLYWLVGLLIFRRKSQEWMGLIFSLMLLALGAVDSFGFPAAQAPQLVQFLTNSIGNVLLAPLAAFFFMTFPTGRFTPRWTWAVFLLIWLMLTPFVPSIVSLLTVPPSS